MLTLCSILLGGLSASLSPLAAEASASDGYYHGERTVSTVWSPTSFNSAYPKYRIPGVVVTKKDTVIIYCEARTGDNSDSLASGNDWCKMDIFIQRSEDGGKTFGDRIYIAKGTRQAATTNNPVMIVGNDNTLHILYCKNYSVKGGGLWYRKSTDDGKTWTPERNISEFTQSTPHDAFAFGPTHGICTREGVLMTAIWLVPKGTGRDGKITSHGPNQAHVFYSEDNGETWKLTGRASTNPNETAIAQLSDGSIILNSRSSNNRRITTSPNGISNWTTTYADETLIDPGCCGGMVTVDLPGLPYAHLFVNCASQSARDHVTLRVSFDDCITWEKSILLDEYNGGYCDVAVDSKGKIYVLYEWSMGARMRLYTCSFVDEFLSDADEKRLSDQTEFSFATEADLAPLGAFNRVEPSIHEDALRLTVKETSKHTFRMDFSSITENLFLHRSTVMAMKVRLNSSTSGNMKLGAYFQTGRLDSYNKEKFSSVLISNDNEWHTVLVDLAAAGVEGRLHGIRFELFTDTLRGVVGDTLDIASVSFFADEETAKRELGLTNEPSSTEEPATTLPTEEAPTAEPPVKKKGCGSAISALSAFAMSALTVLPFFRKRRRKD